MDRVRDIASHLLLSLGGPSAAPKAVAGGRVNLGAQILQKK